MRLDPIPTILIPMSLRRHLPLLLLPAVTGLAPGQGDPAVIECIIQEGKENSHVWETLEYLSHEIGPRLTGSTGLARANAWTRDEFRRMGLTGCKMVKWGDVPVRFDRGPCSAKMIAPEELAFEFTARSWSAGTEGPVRGPVVRMPKNEEEFEAVKGSLEGAWVLSTSSGRRSRNETDEQKAEREAAEAIRDLVRGAGIAGSLTGSRNDLVITGGSWRDLTMDNLPTDVSVQVIRTHFERMEELLDAGESVEVEIDLAHYFTEGPFPVYNTVAEIRGTEKPDEVIILSAHLDSWDGPGSMGTQDNGTGSSVMMEAARILMACEVKPKRTIRFCLWTGEEQGLHGSREYVAQLSDEEQAKVSACLVDDGGTNYQGGLVCIASMAPMLDEAIAPVVAAFPDFDIANSTQDKMPGGGSSDHASFNRAGIPGFFWIEKGKGGREEKDYRFIHHTQHDTTRYAVPEYLVQSAVSSAVVAYNLAQAETMLPREAQESDAEGSDGPEPDQSFVVEKSGLTGPWKAQLVGENAPDLAFVMDLQLAKDGRVRGMLKSAIGEAAINKGAWDADKSEATIEATGEAGALKLSAKLEGEAVKGHLSLGGSEYAYEAERMPLLDSPLNGAWKVSLPAFEATVDLSMAVGEDGVLRGWFKSSSSDSALYKGTWDAKTQTATFEYDYPHAGRLPVTGTYKDGVFSGMIGDSTEFHGKRAEG